jgi:hypothetical protein
MGLFYDFSLERNRVFFCKSFLKKEEGKNIRQQNSNCETCQNAVLKLLSFKFCFLSHQTQKVYFDAISHIL